MTMCIIIYMNIYISKENEKKLRQLEDWTMSGLINYLLTEYWKTHTVKGVKTQVEPEIKKLVEKKIEKSSLCKIHAMDKRYCRLMKH